MQIVNSLYGETWATHVPPGNPEIQGVFREPQGTWARDQPEKSQKETQRRSNPPSSNQGRNQKVPGGTNGDQIHQFRAGIASPAEGSNQKNQYTSFFELLHNTKLKI